MSTSDDLLNLVKDAQVNVRIPKALKRELARECKAKGYKNVSTYILAILLDRPKIKAA